MTKKVIAGQVGRRGLLMAELFLQELEPQFVAEPTFSDFVFDFFVGFQNSGGGINTFAIEVKATERKVGRNFVVSNKLYRILANSNVPVMFLLVDVKNNQFYYSWPSDHPDVSQLRNDVRVPITLVDDEQRIKITSRMTA